MIRQREERSGFLYLSVLFTSLIVIATAAAAFSISTNRLRSEQTEVDASRAMRAAESETHRIASIISTADLSWRSNEANGTLSARRAGDGNAVLRYSLADSDGNLADDPSDPVDITCIAAVGNANRSIACTLTPVVKPLSLLSNAMISAGSIQFATGATFACSGTVESGSSVIVAAGATVSASSWKATAAVAPLARGEHVVTGRIVSIPASTITSNYIALGTQIPVASLPFESGARRLRRVVITSSLNPYSSPDSDGVYWIDAAGAALVISECRIDATLVVINCSQVTITSANLWKPPIEGGAAILTTAAIRIDGTVKVLREWTAAVNCNPVLAPWRGIGDVDMSDRYTSSLEGIVYTPGLFDWTATNAANGMMVRGTIVCGSAVISGPMFMDDDRSSELKPPLGFRSYDSMRFVRGSWRSLPVLAGM